MECRWALVSAVGLCCGAFGCVHTDAERKSMPEPPANSAETESIFAPPGGRAEGAADKNKPKRKPKPATCVSMGRLRENAADNPACPPSEQLKIRQEAEASYQEALKIDPKCQAAYQALGRLYDKMGNYDRAVQTFQAGLALYPKDSVLYYEFGMCQLRHKEWDAGLTNLHKAAELEPKNAQYAKALGFSLARVGRYDESYACLKDVVGEAQAHCYLARMLHHLKQDAESLEHVQLALRADPQMKPAQLLLEELQGRTPAQGQVSAQAKSDQ